jgi:two-component system response regulator YesN
MIKVLLVDDESWNRDLLRTFGDWEQYGMEVAGEAEDGLEALQLVEDLSPQVVITDMRMPGADGVQLLQILNDRYPDIKVIVVSGYDDFNYTKHAIRYKAMDYLLKPVDPKELNAALQKCKSEWEAAALERGTLPLDLDVSFSLSSFKQLLRSYFNELNIKGVRTVFDQMIEELERSRIVHPHLLEQVIQEMLLFLKELMMANSLETEGLKAPIGSAVLSSRDNAIAFLSQHYLEAQEQLIQQRKFKNKLNLSEIRHYIEHHYSEPITLEQLAKVFFVSKEYLSKVFKLEYGLNVTDYILHLRMDKAREWLKDENIPIKTVAEMAGYEDVSYFYRVFKKHFGIAPGEMRKNIQV